MFFSFSGTPTTTPATPAIPQLPQTPVQLPTTPSPLVSPTKTQTPTIIRMASPVAGATPGILRTVGQGQNIVRVRAPAPGAIGAPQHIKVVGSSGQIIKTTTVSAGQATAAGIQVQQQGTYSQMNDTIQF